MNQIQTNIRYHQKDRMTNIERFFSCINIVLIFQLCHYGIT